MSFTMTAETRSALEILNSGNNVLLTGRAGTGKSTLLRKFMEEHGDEPSNNVLVVAPTGVAALNVGGSTIHRAFGFRPGMYPDDVRGFSGYHPSSATRNVLKAVHTIIIDEISMVRADLFDMMNLALSQIRNVAESFGGVRLIMIGDLLQLPPVVTDNEREEFLERWSTPYFFSAHCYPSLSLRQIHLEKIWRQSDEEFIEILNQVREGHVSEDALTVLNSRVRTQPPVDEGFLTLTSRRRRVSQINRELLTSLGAEIYHSQAHYEGATDENAFPGDPELQYAAGARVMTVTNDPLQRFVNGSMGTVLTADADHIQVVLDEGPEVRLERHTWEFRRPVVINGVLSSEVVGTVTQFPVILAWAITIHKSQGKTVPKCIIDLSGGTTTDGQFYVALSRAVSLENLYFTQPVRRANVLADASLVRRIRRDITPDRVPRRLLFLSSDHVDFGMSQHIARIHATVVEDNAITADFGSWINPMADLGDLVSKYAIPHGGMAAAPQIEQFWPLLLRQAEGALVIGDGLATLERAVRHQARSMKVDLGVGYDIHDFNLLPAGDDPVARCESMVLSFFAGDINPQRGIAVSIPSTDPGSLFIPSWAPAEVPQLDHSRAAPDDLAWAALSGDHSGSVPEDLLHTAAAQASETASLRGGWNRTLRGELIQRVQEAGGTAPTLPEVIESTARIGEFLVSGARVAFTGGGVILGETRSDDELIEICATRGLEFKKAMSKSRCDVLIADDISTMSNKAKLARQYKKPIFSTEDFSTWYLNRTPETGERSGELAHPEKDDTPVLATPLEPGKPDLLNIEPALVSEPHTEHVRYSPAAEVLHPGTRVAVSGSVHVDGERFSRGGALEQLLENLGLVYKSNVSRNRCDVLIAEPDGPGSGNLRSAVEFAKPIVTSSDFAEWAAGVLSSPPTSDVSEEPATRPHPKPLAPASPVENVPHASEVLRNEVAAYPEPVHSPVLEYILAGHDFDSAASLDFQGILPGRRAAIFATQEELNRQVLRESPPLAKQPSRAARSIKHTLIALAAAVISFIIIAVASGDAEEGPWVAILAIIMLAVIIGLPAAVIRIIYLATRSRRDGEAARESAIQTQLGGAAEETLPVIVTGERSIPPLERKLLEQMCGFHDYLSARGYPIPADSWRDLVNESVGAMHAFERNGDRRTAEKVGTKISDWVAGAEAAFEAQQQFRN